VLFNPQYDPNTYSVANGQIMADFAVTQGRMPREEAEAWMRDLQRLGSQGRYFFMNSARLVGRLRCLSDHAAAVVVASW
jgi:hypothetical protein